MAGTKIKSARKKLEAEIAEERKKIDDEKLKIAQDLAEGKVDPREYRGYLIKSDYGEIQRLWRTQYLQCTNPDTLTEREILDAVVRAHGVIAVLARILGLKRHQTESLIKKYPSVKRAVAEERENLVDLAECRLFEATNYGEEWAVKFVLQCLGKNRGWTKEISPAENKGKILEAINKMTEMDDEELDEYDKEFGY